MWPSKLRNEPIPAIALILASGLIATFFGAINSTLIFDDPFLYEHFDQTLRSEGLLNTLRILFLNLDLHAGVPEYRTYGVSKVLHFLLWTLFGPNAWKYSAFIGLSQTGTALLLFLMVRRVTADSFQALLVSLIWILSPFAVTTCFHHYSYLILPVQISLFLAFIIQTVLLTNGRLTPSGSVGLVLGGLLIALTGEQHLALSTMLLGLIIFWTRSSLGIFQRSWFFILITIPEIISIILHRKIWSSLGPEVEIHRFNFATPSPNALLQKTIDYLYSLPKGAAVQINQILGYSIWATLVFLLITSCTSVLLYKLKKENNQTEATDNACTDNSPDKRSIVIQASILALLVAASFSIVWVRAIFFSQTGDILPRRYGYIPYTLTCMAIVGYFCLPSFRQRFGTIPAILITSCVIGLWGSLEFVCLRQIRYEDESLWKQINEAMQGKTTPHVLFINSLNKQGPTGFDAPGIRERTYPPLFESPFMRYGWQGQYTKIALGAVGTGDAFVASGNGLVTLTGQLNGIHFVKAPPLVTAEDSLVVVVDSDYTTPAENKGVQGVRVIRSWAEFQNTPAYLQIKTNVGWNDLLAGIFNDSQDEVAIDLGQKAESRIPGVLPDKSFNSPSISNSLIANYGYESGDDAMFAPSKGAGEPLSYLTTNRHGAFTYRIDFLDNRPKQVCIDLLDWWANSPGFRVIALEMALDDKWVNLGKIDTYALAKNEPLSIKIPVSNVTSIRIRLTAAPSSKDIPFANGIRIKALSSG